MFKQSELKILNKYVIQQNPMLDIHIWCKMNQYLHTMVSFLVKIKIAVILLDIIIIHISHD